MNKSLLLEDLTRINSIMNYRVGNGINENLENIKITSKEIIDNLILESLKLNNNLILEQWARGTDQIGYWKILFEQLTKAGIGVKWQTANNPAKSTYMYWGPWVINKDINKNGGWPITFTGADKKLWLFKFKGGKYAGQPANNIILESKFINSTFNLSEWGKVTGAVGGPQFSKLIKSKPKSGATTSACKTIDGKPIAANQLDAFATKIFKELAYAFDGAGTYENEAVAAIKKITCKPLLDRVNTKILARKMQSGTFSNGPIIKNVGDWAKDEMSDYDYTQYRAIWSNLQKLGYKAPPVNYAMATAGVVGKYATPLGAIEALGEGAKKAYDKLVNMSIEEIMEGFRGIVWGTGGVIATLILSVIPGGNFVNTAIFGVLTAWDIYQLSTSSKDFSWFNLLLDLFSLALSIIPLFGSAAKPLIAAKGVAQGEKTMGGMFKAIEASFPKLYSLLKSLTSKVASAGKGVVSLMKRCITWLTTKLPFLSKFGAMLNNSLNSVTNLLNKFITSLSEKATMQTIGTTTSKLAQTGTAYLGKIGNQLASKAIAGLESKVGTEVAKHLDKKALQEIEKYLFSEGSDFTIKNARPGICKLGKLYCDTFDVAMNGLSWANEGRYLWKHSGKSTVDKVKKIKDAETAVDFAKSASGTTKKTFDTYGKLDTPTSDLYSKVYNDLTPVGKITTVRTPNYNTKNYDIGKV